MNKQDPITLYFSQMKEMFGNDIYLSKELRKSVVQAEHNSLSDFEKEINSCQKCDLGKTRIKFVFGVGNPEADLVFVGEAPGRDEDIKGEPFVGRAGRLLDKILTAINLTRNDVYICNILKCRPPDNRTPNIEEIEMCIPFLETQLAIIKPKLIVALGATAAHSLLNVKTPLGKMRSQIWKWREHNLVVTYHPAALLRNPNFKRPTWEDFQWIKKMIDEQE